MWIGCRGRRPDGIAKREGSGSERRERARGTSHHCHAASPAIATLLRQAGCERGIRLMHEPLGCSAAVSASVGAGDGRELDLDGRQPSLERGGHTGRCGRHDVLKGGRKAGRWAREVRVVDVGRAGRRLWHEAREKVGAHGRCAAASAGPRGHSGRARHAEGCRRPATWGDPGSRGDVAFRVPQPASELAWGCHARTSALPGKSNYLRTCASSA